jgi:hypothetical protein
MQSCRQNLVWCALFCAVLSCIAGCGTTATAGSGGGGGGGTGGTPPPVGNFTGLGFSGTVLTGKQPVQGAAVQLYAAGTAGNGSAPTQLLAAALTTDTSGAFHVAAGSYTCPGASSIFYLTATGGSLGSGSANAARVLATVPGRCDSVGSASFVLNEVTTVATAYALRPFLSADGQLGATATNLQGLTLAAGTLARLVNLSTGAAPGAGFPANGTAPEAKLNTVANNLYACSGTGPATVSGCASLFRTTTAGSFTPTDTFAAAISVANHPANQLLTLSTTGPVFSPSLTAYPPDWTLAIPFTGGGMNGPAAVSIDSTGNIWVANYFDAASLFANSGAPVLANGVTGSGLHESYGGAVDATDRFWATDQESDYSVNGGNGSLTVLTSAGSSPALISSGGIYFPVALAFDRSGNAWVAEGNSRVSVFSGSGAPLSGASGYGSDQLAFPLAVAVDSKGNGWLPNSSASTVTKVAADGSTFTSYTVGNAPSAVAVDAQDNVWTANYQGDSLGLVSSNGQVLSNGGFTGGGLVHPTGVAVDGAGTAWVANYRAPGISSLAGASATVPGAALSPSTGWGADQKMTEAFGVAIDAAGNVWVTSFGDNRLVEFVGAAAPVKTPLLGGVRVP